MICRSPRNICLAGLFSVAGIAQGPLLIVEDRDPAGTSNLGLGLVVGHLNHDALLDAAYIDGLVTPAFTP